MFRFDPVDAQTVRAFSRWRYDPPYDIYNLDLEAVEDNVRYFLDPQVNCHTMTDARGNLVGYCTFGPDGQVPGGDYSAPALDIGLGIHPELTGLGRGSDYVSAVLDFAQRSFAPSSLRVTVAEFNKRALRVWEMAGFQLEQRFRTRSDAMVFVVLMRDV